MSEQDTREPYDWDAPSPDSYVRFQHKGFEYDLDLSEPVDARDVHEMVRVRIASARKAGRVRPLPGYQPEDETD